MSNRSISAGRVPGPARMDQPDPEWRRETLLKADLFSVVERGRDRRFPQHALLVRRDLSHVRWWARPIALWLFRREARMLACMEGVEGAPALVARDGRTLTRSWIEAEPLHVARPADPAFYKDALRLLMRIHRRGVAHNDLAKKPNWLRRSDGGAAVVDFQLASFHPRRGRLFRLLAREDLRHLMKHKRQFCASRMTQRQRRLAASPSLPSRLWMASGKRLYYVITREILGWRDREGANDRTRMAMPDAEAALLAHPAVAAAAVVGVPDALRGQGLYAFVVVRPDAGDRTDLGTRLADWVAERKGAFVRPDIVQLVDELPRDRAGAVHRRVLRKIAEGECDRIGDDAGRLANPEVVARIAAGRKSWR